MLRMKSELNYARNLDARINESSGTGKRHPPALRLETLCSVPSPATELEGVSQRGGGECTKRTTPLRPSDGDGGGGDGTCSILQDGRIRGETRTFLATERHLFHTELLQNVSIIADEELVCLSKYHERTRSTQQELSDLMSKRSVRLKEFVDGYRILDMPPSLDDVKALGHQATNDPSCPLIECSNTAIRNSLNDSQLVMEPPEGIEERNRRVLYEELENTIGLQHRYATLVPHFSREEHMIVGRQQHGLSRSVLSGASEALLQLRRSRIALSSREDARTRIAAACVQYDGISTEHAMSFTDLFLEVHELLFADPFAYLRVELQTSTDRLSSFDADLERAEQQLKDAISVENVTVAENVSCEMVQIEVKALKEMRTRLERVDWVNVDVEEYERKVETFGRMYRSILREHLEHVTRHNAELEMDSAKLQQELTRRVEECTRQEHVAEGEIKKHRAHIAELSHAQDELWEDIMEKLDALQRLLQERNATVDVLLESHQKREACLRSRDVLTRYFQQYLNALEQQHEYMHDCEEWYSIGAKFLDEMNERVLGRPITEEYEYTRVTECLRYLEYYRKYLIDSEALRQSRIRRIENLDMMERTFRLSVDQSISTLDPNRALYADKIKEIECERDGIYQKLNDLETELQQEEAEWSVIQEQLDASGVAYQSPDMEKEELSCTLMDRALQIKRNYLSKEQKILDKAATDLRKLKMVHATSKESTAEQQHNRSSGATVSSDYSGAARSSSVGLTNQPSSGTGIMSYFWGK